MSCETDRPFAQLIRDLRAAGSEDYMRTNNPPCIGDTCDCVARRGLAPTFTSSQWYVSIATSAYCSAASLSRLFDQTARDGEIGGDLVRFKLYSDCERGRVSQLELQLDRKCHEP